MTCRPTFAFGCTKRSGLQTCSANRLLMICCATTISPLLHISMQGARYPFYMHAIGTGCDSECGAERLLSHPAGTTGRHFGSPTSPHGEEGALLSPILHATGCHLRALANNGMTLAYGAKKAGRAKTTCLMCHGGRCLLYSPLDNAMPCHRHVTDSPQAAFRFHKYRTFQLLRSVLACRADMIS